MNGIVAPALAAAVVALIFGRIFVQRWLMREHAAGRMSGRKAGWLFGATMATPWLLILTFVAFRDIGSVWIIALVFLAMAPIQIIPWVAMFRYPDDSPQSKRYPPR
jgi:hypothetical protein